MDGFGQLHSRGFLTGWKQLLKWRRSILLVTVCMRICLGAVVSFRDRRWSCRRSAVVFYVFLWFLCFSHDVDGHFSEEEERLLSYRKRKYATLAVSPSTYSACIYKVFNAELLKCFSGEVPGKYVNTTLRELTARMVQAHAHAVLFLCNPDRRRRQALSVSQGGRDQSFKGTALIKRLRLPSSPSLFLINININIYINIHLYQHLHQHLHQHNININIHLNLISTSRVHSYDSSDPCLDQHATSTGELKKTV